MTTFYWTDTRQEAATDAALKGYSSNQWGFFGSMKDIGDKDLLDYAAVYFRTGINELEREFARIMRESPWSC